MGSWKNSCVFIFAAIAAITTTSCGGPTVHNEWTWVSGSNLTFQVGSYGTQGSPAASNIPGARGGSATWTDKAGNLWLFGGIGLDPAGAGTELHFNDLWKFSGGQWTWMGGSNIINQIGSYGAQGTAGPGNIPGARYGAASWTDVSGNFWLLGGYGYDSSGVWGILNDLWKYSGGEWTWVGGSKFVGQPGIYGTQGKTTSSNVPGARFDADSWTDASGNFWLFGGLGNDSTTTVSYLNDLWKYSGGEWTWMGGPNIGSQMGIYGTQGTASYSNIPGARFDAASWIDASGSLWIFGGWGFDSTGSRTLLGDMWKYSENQWTWMGGSSTGYASGTYGVQGIAAPNNVPGARYMAVSWTDAAGNLWLFGGQGLGAYNDLWKYSPSKGEWTWIGGSDAANQLGTYGTQGMDSASSIPGARGIAVSWTDTSGNLWLFGGEGYSSTGGMGYLNDLWKYQP
ncbi:MAG: kelch repeat-containing protein [Terracidiphilus sp.]